jgi:CubicO group peptidase (beta-lactamase class C family)
MTAPSVAHHAPIADFIADIDTLAAGVMADWKVPGAALAVVHDGTLVLLKAYGEFRGEGLRVDEIVFYEPNSTFVAKRAVVLKTDQGVTR